MKLAIRLAFCFLIAATARAQNSGIIFVVRHAEKASDAANTPLSQKGMARAECLAKTLKDAQIGTALVTQYVRTEQTAAPTVQESKAHEKKIEAMSYPKIVEAARTAAKSGNVLIVGHSNTVPDLLKAFGTPPVTIPDTAYDQLFIFNMDQPKQLMVLHYCPDLPSDATAHPMNSMAEP